MNSLAVKNKKINVLYLSNQDRFLGGAERSLCDLIEHLDRTKINPYFVSIFDGEVAEYVKKLGVTYLKINAFNRKNPVPYIVSQIQLIRFIIKNKIGIIHNNRCSESFYSWLPAFLTNTKTIIHHRDSTFTKMDRFLINHVDCNISISSWQNKQFLDNKAVLIPNGIDLDKIPQHFEVDHTKSADLKNKLVLVGAVGRIAPNKGQHIFINAAKIVLEKNPDIRFIIIGDINSGYYSDYYQELINQISRLGIDDKVLFKGFVNNVGDIYPELDISVIPSLREPFGRVIIESMAFYKPVIATNIGGPVDIVTEQTGILVPVNDPTSLADAILFLACNPAVRADMGNAGRERVENHFTISRTLSKIYDVYDGLLCNQEMSQGDQ